MEPSPAQTSALQVLALSDIEEGNGTKCYMGLGFTEGFSAEKGLIISRIS